jgi:hypothetical protein
VPRVTELFFHLVVQVGREGTGFCVV